MWRWTSTNLPFQVMVTWMAAPATHISITAPLQDKLKEWPHVGPLRPGLAWTIASLCWSILHFSLARLRPLTTAWVISFPLLLHVYGALALNCLWYHRPWVLRVALFEKTSRTGWKEPSRVFYSHKPDTGNPLLGLSLSAEFSPSFSIPHWSVGQVPVHDTLTAHCDDCSDNTHEMTQGDKRTVFSK